jgi:hypothetical protein
MAFAAVVTIIVAILYLVSPNAPALWFRVMVMAWMAGCWTYILHKYI